MKNSMVVRHKTAVTTVSPKWLKRFKNRHELDASQVATAVELSRECEAGLPYIGRMLKEGHVLPQVVVAYRLRDELGTLGEPERGELHSAQFPIKACCQFLTILSMVDDCDDSDLEALAGFFSEMSNRYTSKFMTWPKIVAEVLDTLAKADLEEISEYSAYEKIEYLYNHVFIE